MEAGFSVLPLTGEKIEVSCKPRFQISKKKPGERINQPVTRLRQQQPVLLRDSSLQLLHSS